MALDALMDLLHPRADLAGKSDADAAAALGVTAAEITAARAEIARRIATVTQRAKVTDINRQAVADIEKTFTDPAKPVPTLDDFKAFVAAQ